LKSQVKDFLKAILGEKNQNQLIAVIGICKNAGKTTLLNWLIQETDCTPLGVITTGRDGEDVDLITNESKPKINLPINAIFSTFAEEIENHSPYVEVLEKLPYRAGGRNLWLVRTTKPLPVEIVGPATAEAQVLLAKHILSLGAQKVFIDGSFDRKAISLQENVDSLILVVSPAIGKEKEILREITRLHALSKILSTTSKWNSEFISYQVDDGKWKHTEYRSLLSQEKETMQSLDMITEMKTLYFPCPITDKGFPVLKSFLLQFEGDLILRHPFLLNISLSNLNWLKNNCHLKTVYSFRLKAIAVNSYAVNGKHVPSDMLRSEIRKSFKKLPVIDVKEIIS
jgi:hypothetical protein